MRKIYIKSCESVASQIFDYYQAYRQALCKDMRSNIVFDSEDDKNADCTILIQSVDDCLNVDTNRYDLIFLDNGGESLENCSVPAKKLLDCANVYLLTGSYVWPNHPFWDKIIPFNHNHQSFVDYIARRFYPQYYQLRSTRPLRNTPMCFINGANRAWRHYFLTLLKQRLRVQIPILNNIGSSPTKILDSQFESKEDTEFREWVNLSLDVVDDQHQKDIDYHNQALPIGIAGSFGSIPPGYFFLPEYFQSKVIIYPETSWTNDHLFITEKTWKCFAARAIPWPVAGARINQQLNDFGYGTAWNLLPSEHQAFDHELNHMRRYQLQIQAIEWAHAHPEIWHSSHAEDIKTNNLEQLMINDSWDQRWQSQLDRLLL